MGTKSSQPTSGNTAAISSATAASRKAAAGDSLLECLRSRLDICRTMAAPPIAATATRTRPNAAASAWANGMGTLAITIVGTTVMVSKMRPRQNVRMGVVGDAGFGRCHLTRKQQPPRHHPAGEGDAKSEQRSKNCVDVSHGKLQKSMKAEV